MFTIGSLANSYAKSGSLAACLPYYKGSKERVCEMSVLEDWMNVGRITVYAHVSEDYLRPGYIAGESWNPAENTKKYRVVFTDIPVSRFVVIINNEEFGIESAYFTEDQIEIVEVTE
jgi:hypothetical protein